MAGLVRSLTESDADQICTIVGTDLKRRGTSSREGREGVHLDGPEIKLTPTKYSLLRVLVQNAGKL